MLLETFLALVAASANPVVTIVPKGQGYRATAAPFNAFDAGSVDAEIELRASEKCPGKTVKWGEFGSLAKIDREAALPPKVTGYYKEFSCVTEQLRHFAPAPADWQPSSADDADVRTFFGSYYAKRDSGDFAAASAMFDPAQGASVGGQEQREFNARLGPGVRRITKITWYVNPDGAAHPGVFAALDFIGDYKSKHLYCGYLVLYRVGPNAYEIVREEQNIFDRNDNAPDPDLLATMRSSACREG